MKKLLISALSTVLLLSSIGYDQQAQAATPKKLNEKTKIALAYFTKDIGKYSFKRKEIISGKYILNYPEGKSKKYSKTFDVVRLENKFKGAPKDMKFYTTKIPKSNFVTVIGVSDSTIVLGGTQSVISFKTLVKYGKKYNMKSYLKYKSTKDYKTIVSKMRFVKSIY